MRHEVAQYKEEEHRTLRLRRVSNACSHLSVRRW